MDNFIREKAYFLFDEYRLPDSKQYSRIYIGNEFCDRRIPSVDFLKRIAKWCSGAPMELTLVTPCMTDAGLKPLKAALDYLSGENKKLEVVINDWGVLRVLRRDYPSSTFILGRILVSRYLCRFFSHEAVGQFSSSVEKKKFYCFFPGAFLELMKEYGIKRFEFNSYNHLYLTQEQLIENGIMAHIYFPYTYLTVTRHCRFPNHYDPVPLVDVTICHDECVGRYAVLSNCLHERELIEYGNARFIKEKDIFHNTEYSIDRVIYNDFKLES